MDTQGPLMVAFTSTTELRTVPGLRKASPPRRWWLPRFTGEHAEVWALEEVVVRGLEMRLGRQGVPERAPWFSRLQMCPAEPRSLAGAVVTARRPSTSNARVPGSGFVFPEFQATC